MKRLLYSILLITLFSCNSQEDSKEQAQNQEKTSEEVVVSASSLKFGSTSNLDPVNLFLVVTNNTKFSVSLKKSGDIDFSIQSEQKCENKVPVNETCRYTISFLPQSSGQKNSIIAFGDKAVTLEGTGLISNQLRVSPTVWNVGAISAGSVHTKEFLISNAGDNEIDAPVFMDARFSVIESTCNNTIRPRNECKYTVRFQDTFTSSLSNANIEITSPSQGATTLLDFISEVNPSVASGEIEMLDFPTQINANGIDSYLVRARITDEFGNTVKDNTACSIQGTNVVLDKTQEFTSDGLISFTLTSTTIKAPVEIFTTCELASGFKRIIPLSGDIFGEITFENYNAFIPADGNSSLTVQTKSLRDQNNQIVDDGKIIFVEIAGPGVLVRDQVLSVDGRAFVEIDAETLTGVSTITLRSNPIVDQFGVVSGYRAQGSFEVEFIPVGASGDFDIISENSVIYAGSDQVPSGLSKTSQIEIGPIVDTNGNLKGSGTIVDVTLINATSFDVFEGNSIFSVVTGEDSVARFTLQSTNSRGEVSISANVEGNVQTTELFAVARNTVTPQASLNNISIYKSFVRGSDALEDYLKYKASWSIDFLSARDDFYIGGEEHLGYIKEISESSFPVASGCLVSNFDRVFHFPCLTVGSDNTGSLFYGNTTPRFLSINSFDATVEVSNINATPNDPGYLFSLTQGGNIFSFEQSGKAYFTNGIDRATRSHNDQLIVIEGISSFNTQFDQMTTSTINPPFTTHDASHGTVLKEDGKVYIFGGFRSTSSTTAEFSKTLTIHEYDESAPNSERIRTTQYTDDKFESSFKGYSGSAILIRGRTLYVIGGYYFTPQGTTLRSDEIWSIDLDNLESGFQLVCNCAPTDAYYNAISTHLLSGGGDRYEILLSREQTAMSLKHVNEEILIIADREVYEIDENFNFTPSVQYDALERYQGHHYNELTNKIYMTRLYTDSFASRDDVHSFYVYGVNNLPRMIIEATLLNNSFTYAQNLDVKVSGFATGDSESALIYEVYNFDTDSWDSLGESNLENLSQSISNFEQYSLLGGITSYLNEENKLYISARPKETIATQGQSYDFRLNYFEIEGVY